MESSFWGTNCWKFCAYKENINSTGKNYLFCALLRIEWLKNPCFITTRTSWTLQMSLTYPAVFVWHNIIYSFQFFGWGILSLLERVGDRELRRQREGYLVPHSIVTLWQRIWLFLRTSELRWTLATYQFGLGTEGRTGVQLWSPTESEVKLVSLV